MGTSVGYQESETMPHLSNHAGSRMATRHISQDDVATVMSYGRTYYVRGAMVYALGRREADIAPRKYLAGTLATQIKNLRPQVQAEYWDIRAF